MIEAINRLLLLERKYLTLSEDQRDACIEDVLALKSCTKEELRSLMQGADLLLHVKEKRNLAGALDYKLHSSVKQAISPYQTSPRA